MSFIINPYQFAAAGGGLTEYPSGIDFAVSTREIPGLAWTGLIFKVRRSSDNAELSFYQGATEYNWNTTRGGGGTDLETWVGAGSGYVIEWYRQDGSSGKLSQSVSANAPKIIDAGTLMSSGGFAALWFDSSNSNYMTIDATTPPSNLVSHTSMYAGNRVASGGYGMLMTRGGSTDGWSIARWGDNYVKQRTTDGQDEANSTSTTTAFEILAAKATSTSHSMDNHAGNIASTHTETGYGTIDFNEYGRWSVAGVYANFKVVEHIYYNGEARTDYQDIIDFMASEFGL